MPDTPTTLVHVVAVDVVGKHRLHLAFEDGTTGDIDFDPREWRGVLAPLRDPALFAQVAVDDRMGTLVWPGGLDIAPEPLYEQVRQQQAAASQH